MEKGKCDANGYPYITLPFSKRIFGDDLDRDALVIDDEVLNAESPVERPIMPEDPAERKKVYTQYVKRLYGTALKVTKKFCDEMAELEKQEREKGCVAHHIPNSSSTMTAHHIPSSSSSSTMPAAAAAAAASRELKNLQLKD